MTLYDHPGVHIFMNIDGRFFGTSDGAGGGNPRGGAGWLDDGAPDASSRVYKPYHFVSSVLRSSTTAGHIVSFQLGALATPVALALGDKVQVTYTESSAGSLFATAITYPGSSHSQWNRWDGRARRQFVHAPDLSRPDAHLGYPLHVADPGPGSGRHGPGHVYLERRNAHGA